VTRVAWFHCFAGIAGDMAFGSLVDAGADLGEVLRLVERVPVGGWSVVGSDVMRNGLGATRLEVVVNESGIVRTYAHIRGLLEEARLPPRVLARSLSVFERLAVVEGRLHRRPVEQVHFHEVGGVDAIVDVVGTCAALEVLDVDVVAGSAVATGVGMIRSAHGLLPNPAPAVVALLEGIPTYGVDLSAELTTPTGAALLAALGSEFGPMPAMTVEATGFGAGSREHEQLPNLTQVVLGVGASVGLGGGGAAPVIELAANLDDATGETLAHAVVALLEAGAVDAWVTPVVMKKGRPGHVVTALCDEALGDQVARVLMSETGTLGVRGRVVSRWLARRATASVEVSGLPVRIKVSPGRVKAEHDDAARVARRIGLPLREVTRLAEEAWRAGDWAGESENRPPDGDAG
jgi:pyridinium-3,5-bisthiocarboxylic acid mononucleotide nickel chelatase